MNKPLVTVVIPCHNYARFVVDAIRSVQVQTLNNLECFIVNDCSTDNSHEVIAQAIQGDKRLMIVDVDFGSLSATRNYGLSLGTAPYLCCLDADDEMGSEEYLEVMVSALEKDRTLGVAFSSIQVMDENGKLGHVPNWPNGYDFDQQCAHINQVTSLCVFTRKMWERAGGFRPYFRYAEDADFWTTGGMIGFGGIHATTQPWFHYRLHNKSASQVHRTGEIPEPDWLEFHPGAKDGKRPFAAGGRAPRGSWPVRFYHEPEVSIIIPVGVGHEQWLGDALHSVEGQTHRYWECIVVNDSGHKLDLTGFPWARVIECNYLFTWGAGVARNLGAKVAKAPFLVFLDADDLLKPTFLEDTLAAYQKHGRYAYVDWLTHDKMTNWQVHPTPEYSLQAVKDKPSIHPITCLIPQKWFWDVGGFDEQMPAFEDVDLFMKLLTHGYCGVRVPKPLLIYNLDSGYRRKGNDAYRPTFEALLKKRYGKFMEEHQMCDCVQPPKGKTPMAPTPENAAEFKETYGDMVLAKLVGRFVPEAPATFRGPATRVLYGRRAKGDIFYIWQADLENGGDTFELVNNYTTEPQATEVPPPPPLEVDLPPNEVHNPMMGDGQVEGLPHKPTVGERQDTVPPEDTKPTKVVKNTPSKSAAKNAKGGKATKGTK